MFGYKHIDKCIQCVEMQCRVNFFNTMRNAIILIPNIDSQNSINIFNGFVLFMISIN